MTKGQGKPVTCSGELLAALLRGDRLTHCLATGHRLELADRPVAAQAIRTLRQGVRLVGAGDALPRIGTSQSYTLEPLLDLADVTSLMRGAIRQAGGMAAYARTKGLSRSQVEDVASGRRNPTPAVLTALGVTRLERYAPARPVRKEVAA